MKEYIRRIHEETGHLFGTGSTGTAPSLVIEGYKGVALCEIEGADTLVMRGRITVANSGEMRAALSKALHGKPPVLHVNLSDVSYIDTSGVATLVEAARTARKQDTRLVLKSLCDQPRYLLETTHLDKLFDIVSQEADR